MSDLNLYGVLTIAAIIGLIPAAIARAKGHSFVGYWIYGAILFIVALPDTMFMKRNQKADEKEALSSGGKRCPHCAEVIKEAANVCRFCRRDV